MAQMAISGNKARRFVRMAQMAGLAIGVCAAALWALQVPGLEGNLPQKPELPPVGPVQAASTTQVAPIDADSASGIAERLEVGANITRAPRESEAPAPAAASRTSEWKYLAPIKETRRTLAIVSRNGKQKVMAPGRTWDDAKLLSVNDDKIVIEDAGGRHEIRRGERTASLVSWTSMASNAPGGSNQMGRGNVNLEQQFANRGIDPEQGQRFREVMRRRAAARRGNGADGLPPHLLEQMGIDPKTAAEMSDDQVQAYIEKARGMLSEEGATLEGALEQLDATKEKNETGGEIH